MPTLKNHKESHTGGLDYNLEVSLQEYHFYLVQEKILTGKTL